jgi:hypothetical protein
LLLPLLLFSLIVILFVWTLFWDWFVAPYDNSAIQFAGIDDSKVARQAFGRGLCAIGDRFVAAGSSPSTISLYDMQSRQKVGSVNLSMDIRNAIHGLEVWPFENQVQFACDA